MRNSLITGLLITILSTFPTNSILAQVTLIPDPNFEQALIDLGLDIAPINGSVPTANISSIVNLTVSRKNINDLTGIQDFLALKTLSCDFNNLTSLDVTHNIALTVLACGNNLLTTIDITHNTALDLFICQTNAITNLDVTHNIAMTDLACAHNKIIGLDLTKNINLKILDGEDNLYTFLDVTKCTLMTTIYCQGNLLSNLDVTKNPGLIILACDGNKLPTIDVSKNVALGYFSCEGNLLPSLDVTKNLNLQKFWCDYNLLPTIDVTKNIALTDFGCSHNQLPTLDVTKNTVLQQFWCDYNLLPTLDITKNTALTLLSCSHNQLPTLDVTRNTVLQQFWCDYNLLPTLDITKNTALTLLSCSHNQLPTLDVTKNTVLQQFWCDYNLLPTLDITKNTALTLLSCSFNQMTALDVIKNITLSSFICNNNKITSLDITKNTSLTELRCFTNLLTELNLRNGFNNLLTTMRAVNNTNLTCIQVDNAILAAGYGGWTKDATANYDNYCVPTIFSFTPSSGCNGQIVNITGANLNVTTSVTFGGVQASSFTMLSANNITAVVGSGASGNIDIVTPGGTASISGFVFTQIPTPAGVSISSSVTTICTGSSVTFIASPTNGGANPSYQWQINGINVGTNSAIFATNSLVNGDNVKVIMTSSSNCVVGSPATSNVIPITITPTLIPAVTIIQSTTTICAGTSVTFNATPINGGANPVYQWQVNGNNVGTNSPVYSSNTLNNNDLIKCVVTSNYSCVTTPNAASNILHISVNGPVIPSVSISASDNNICNGTLVTFTATPVNGGANPVYQWQVNGNNVGTNNPVFSTSSIVNSDIISCTMTNPNSCSAVTLANSNQIVMIVKTTIAPSLSISASVNDVCPNSLITFTALSANVGTIPSYQWGTNGIKVGGNNSVYANSGFANGDKINCIMNTVTSCSTTPFVYSDTVIMIIKPVPVVSIIPANPMILLGTSIQISATITGNLMSYLWIPSIGLNSATTLNPIASPLTTTTYDLSVIADNNCTVNKSLIVTVLKDIYIPNSFTPNGDNNNDIFRIPPGTFFNLENFVVYDRYGNEVFKTTDINRGWDGTYKGTKSPQGAYTYLIKGTGPKGAILLKGTVLIIR